MLAKKSDVVQRVISAQLDQYDADLKAKDKKVKDRLEKESLEGQAELFQPDEETTPCTEVDQNKENMDEDNRTTDRISCIGMRCRLNNHPKQIISVKVGNRSGPKKCCTCQQFETAMKKIRAIEAYIVEQLQTEEEDMSEVLQGLADLMGASRHNKVERRAYYNEILSIPKVLEILKLPVTRKPDGKCPNKARPTVVFLAATFGIALARQIPTEPLPGLTPEEANELWGKDEGDTEERDSWQQFLWLINNYSVTKRLEIAEEKAKEMGDLEPEVQRILRKVEKVNKIKEKPTSLATAIPKRKRGGLDDNESKKKSKIDTVNAARDIVNTSESLMEEMYQAYIQRGMRETLQMNGRGVDLSREDDEQCNPDANITNGHGRRVKDAKRNRSEIESTEEESITNPSPQKATRTTNTRIARQNQEFSGDENEIITNGMRIKPTLYQLAQIDLDSVKTKDNLMRGTCVQAIVELLQSEKRREELTCVSTDFYSLLLKNKIRDAKSLLHPDEGCMSGKGGEWETPSTRIATAKSRILLIPCHANNHWFLIIRLKIGGGNHKMFVLDSLGKESSLKYAKSIRGNMKRISLIGKKDKIITLDTRGQTEVECGVRMIAYMVIFRNMEITKLSDGQISENIKSQVAREKGFTGDLAERRRKHMHIMLMKEQNKMKK